jgi:polyisoprenoid-binding protein YceI
MVAMNTTTSLTSPFTGSYTVDPDHSSFGFAVRHMGISTFRGTFEDVAAGVEAGADGALSLTGSASVESLSVRSPAELRSHLLSDDFFAAERHPEITFASSGPAVPGADGRIAVPAVLTIRNVARDVVATGTWTAPVEDPFGAVRAALQLSATIDRRDFGMTWNLALPNGGDALGHEVEITAHLELVAA